ncbi:MAG TPA: agmatinase [Clostridiales bacterium]|nr:agmatinase [Clostridiales bacterium]
MTYVPWGELATEDFEKADILLKGIPWDCAASGGKGAAEAPDRIRQLSKILPPITESGIIMDQRFFIKDEGDFDVDLNWERYFRRIREGCREMFQTGKFCFFLGGDHSVTIPIEEAFFDVYQGKKAGVIHFDSHCDILNEYCGHQWSHACTQRRVMEHENAMESGFTFVGIRSWEAGELDFLSKHPEIKVIHAFEIYERGIKDTIDTLLERYQGFDAIYLTLDIDVLDPAYAPGTGTPEGGGLSTREMMQIIKALFRELPIKAMDIVEVSPPLDSSDITSWAALKIMYEVFGQLCLKK